MINKLNFLCLLFFCFQISAEEKVDVDVYVYHLQPPFIVNSQTRTGLYYDFATYLNSKSTKFHFDIVFVPRKRVGNMLDDDRLNGILLGVSPVWFQDKMETKFLWTKSVHEDQDEIVSLVDNPIEYTGAESLTGKILGGVRGFYYYGISEKVTEGKIARYDTIGEDEVLQMVLLKRVDFGIISRSTLSYLVEAKNWQDTFYLSKQPHDKYQRRVLVPYPQKAVFDEIAPIVNKIAEDPKWQQTLLKYSLLTD